MITHAVAFRWNPGITAADVASIEAALSTLPGLVPTIRTYACGADLGVGGPGNLDFAIVATFDSLEDWRAYDDHPEHERVRAEVIRPWIAERAAAQFRS